MIEFETPEGRKVWINALSIRVVELLPKSGEVSLALSDDAKVYVMGQGASVAAHITRTLQLINTPVR